MQKMNEKEAIEWIKAISAVQKESVHKDSLLQRKEALHIAIQVLEEIQQYRAIGAVEELKELKENGAFTGSELADIAMQLMTLKKYLKIGKPEECMKAMEKQMPKKPICRELPYSEEDGFNEELLCPTCNSYVGYFTEGMSDPEQMEYCNECGQHIEMDWSE